MKKLKTLLCLLVCICALTAVLTVSVSAATTEIRKVTLMVDEPTLGAKPNTDIWYSDSKFVDITSVEWKGKLDDNGCFTTNMAYSVIIKLKIKDDANAVYGLIEPEDLTINGTKIANTYHYTNDEKTLTVTHTFPFYLKDNGKKTTLTRISNVSITMPAPLAGAVPATKDLVNDNNSNTYVYGIKWDGELDANGCFKAGVKYKVTIGLKVNENAKYMFNKKMSGVSVNGKLGNDQTYWYETDTLLITYTFPATVDASSVTEANNTRMTITAPKVGELPRYDAVIPTDWSSYVKSTKWSGTFDQYGRFQTGKEYTFTVTARVKPTSPSFTFKKNTTNLINDQVASIKSVSSDGKEITLSYKFPALSGSASAPQGTPVETFAAGDYGTITLTSGSARYYTTPDDTKGYAEYDSPKTPIIVLEANVKGTTSNAVGSGLFHAVLRSGKLMYISADDQQYFHTYSDRVKFGSNPAGTYSEAFKTDEDFTGGIIKTISLDALVLEDGKPQMKYQNDLDSSSPYSWSASYYAAGVTYSTDKAQPYTYVTATVTYKPKTGNFFYERVSNDTSGVGTRFALYEDNMFDIKYVDSNTVEVTYTIFARDIYNQDTYTREMQQFAERYTEIKEDGTRVYGRLTGAVVYEAIADPNDLLGDFYDNLEGYFETLGNAENHLRAYLKAAPTYDAPDVRTMDGRGVKVYILDMDVSDMFPGQVAGDWCYVSFGNVTAGFLPKALMKNITTAENNAQGCSGNDVDPKFSFADGTGTKEDPYLIATAEQLNAVRLFTTANAHFKLVADIDLSGWGNWVPIGGTPAYGGWPMKKSAAHYDCTTFDGIFDGNGHTISGMTIKIDQDRPYLNENYNELYFGLFGVLSTETYKDACVKNLTVKDFTIDVTYRAATHRIDIYAGGLAGWVYQGNVKNCKTEGGTINIQCQQAQGKDLEFCIYAGGLAGQSAGGYFENCSSNTSVTVRSNPLDDFFENSYVNPLVNQASDRDGTSLKNSKGTGKTSLTGDAPNPPYSWFVDVPTAKYYYEPVEWAVSKAVTTGTTATTFEPGSTCTRGQIITFLWRAANKPRPTIANPFTDVPAGKYYTEAAIWAYEMGMVSGTTFDRNAPCTRAEAVTYIWKACGAPAAAKAAAFTDVTPNTETARAVSWAVEVGVTNGTGDGTTFSPANSCTRGHIVTFLYRAMGLPLVDKLN